MATVSQSVPSQSSPPQLESSLSWEGEKMFNIYIYDYCYKRGFRKTARELMNEAEIPPEASPPINARQGLLFEWWSVFWVLFTAKANGHGSDDAIIYTQHQANQMLQRNASQRMQPQPGQTNAAGQPPQPGMPHHQSAPMARVTNGINGRPTMMNFGPNGILSNGVPPPGSLQPGAPNPFMSQPNGIPTQPGAPLPQGQAQPFQPMPPGGQRASVGGMPHQQNPQQPPQPQRGPNPSGPFQSPSMPTSPQNPPGAPQLQQQHTQPPMGQLGPSPHLQMNRGGMLPPNQGMNPMNPQGPQGSAPPPQQYPQLGRSPSRAATPSQQGGMMQPSPSMAHRQPPGMQLPPGAGDIGALNSQIMNIPTAIIAQIKAEMGLEGRDIGTLSNAEKSRVVQLYRTKYQPVPGGGLPPDNATPGPSNPMVQMPNQQRPNNLNQRNQPSQQHQRGGKRSSTSPGEEHETLPHNDSPPHERKRPRRSPAEQHAALPMNYNPQTGQMVMNPQGGQMMVNPPGGQGMMVMRGPGPMGMNGAPHPGQPPMGGSMGMGPMGMGPGTGPQPPMGMQHIPGGVAPGGGVGGMPPQMGHPLTPHMQNQQMQAREAMRHTGILPKGPGPHPGGLANMNAGSPSASDPAAHFNLGAGPIGQGPPGGAPGFAQNRMNKNNMMPPPSPALNGPPKDGKPLMLPGAGPAKGPGPGMPNQGMPPAVNHGSPRNQPPGPGSIPPPGSGVPTPGSMVNGGGPPTPAPGNPQGAPAQGPPPPGGGMVPSPSAILSGGGGGAPPPSSASSMDGLFPSDFINSVATGLEDFQFDLTQGAAGDINFERDFGQWFNNPDDPMSGLDGMK